MIRVTAANLTAIARGAKPEIVNAIVQHQGVLAQSGVLDTPLRAAHFFAQVAHETQGLTRLEESLYYTTAKRLTQVWPSRFPTEASAAPYVRQPQKLANKVYGGRLGNTGPDDGWRYRGSGCKQTTGKANFAEVERETGEPVVANPDMLRSFPLALTAAGVYWKNRPALMAAADRDDVVEVTKKINGGTIGLADRKAYLARAKNVNWGHESVPVAPTWPILRNGDSCDKVRHAQERLLAHGFSPGKIDGVFGDGTEDAVKLFQESRGLVADGTIGPATWPHLEKIAAPAPSKAGGAAAAVVVTTVAVGAATGLPWETIAYVAAGLLVIGGGVFAFLKLRR